MISNNMIRITRSHSAKTHEVQQPQILDVGEKQKRSSKTRTISAKRDIKASRSSSSSEEAFVTVRKKQIPRRTLPQRKCAPVSFLPSKQNVAKPQTLLRKQAHRRAKIEEKRKMLLSERIALLTALTEGTKLEKAEEQRLEKSEQLRMEEEERIEYYRSENPEIAQELQTVAQELQEKASVANVWLLRQNVIRAGWEALKSNFHARARLDGHPVAVALRNHDLNPVDWFKQQVPCGIMRRQMPLVMSLIVMDRSNNCIDSIIALIKELSENEQLSCLFEIVDEDGDALMNLINKSQGGLYHHKEWINEMIAKRPAGA